MPEDLALLQEATKWSLLFEEKSTKDKDGLYAERVDYVLNPIYSPYFNISYRKGRKLEFTTEQIQCLLRGTLGEFRSLIRAVSKRWKLSEEETLPLFPNSERS